MYIKRSWPWWWLTSKPKRSTNSSDAGTEATRSSCNGWGNGFIQQQVEEVVMESTAQYWKPVWGALEQYGKPSCEKREGAGRMSGTLHLAQALSNGGRRGRKRDFRDAERLLKRLVSQKLTLSFVPDGEQRLWRTVTRTKYQLRRNKVRLHNQLEALLEEAHLKLSSLVSDLLGASARRMLQALAEGETDPAALPPWPTSVCAPLRRSCAMHWVRARSSTRSTAGW